MAAHPTARLRDHGPLVSALQIALHHALGAHATNLRNGKYGERTRADVARWKRSAGITPANGDFFGDRAWDRILAKNQTPLVVAQLQLDADARRKDAQRAAELDATTLEAKRRALIVAEMQWLIDHRMEYVYRQVRPIGPYNLRDPLDRDRLDCSSTATCCYHAAGAPDPNGLGYNGQGFTGTLWANGVRTTSPLPGDLAFFGWDARGWPEHVAAHMPKGAIGSFGHTPPTLYLEGVAYRTDYIGSRNYF